MTMAAFTDAAHAWADAGIVPLPIAPDGKKPMVKHPDRFGQRAALEIVHKPTFANANLGFLCGAYNGLTIVDIDSQSDAELQHALDTFGDSPAIVGTPSGRHIYYAHAGEGRHIRPDNAHDIDVLGGDLCVAPPSSKPDGRRYDWLRGGLADVRNLPAMRAGARQKLEPTGAKIEEGRRGTALFHHCRSIVGYCDTLDQLIDAARTWAEDNLAGCFPEAEILKTAYSVWKFQGGRKQVMQNLLEGPTYMALVSNLNAFALFSYLSAENGPRSRFMVADGLGTARGWPRRFVPEARKALLQMGLIKCIRAPRKSVPGLYRWSLNTAGGEGGGVIKDYIPILVGHLGAGRE
jgi:hypothetical protein